MDEKVIQEIFDKISFVENFLNKLKVEQPYYFNIVDHVKIDENAHSKILGKLLQFEENGKHDFLESYLKYFNIDVEIIKPCVQIEKGRIDVSIIDLVSDFGVVIENKIHNAVDQKNQIKRYYEQVKEKGINENNIYIQYLSRDGMKSPESFSLSEKLKEKLGDRYQEISYSDDILSWIIDEVLPNCRVKNKELIYSLELYIKHIKKLTNNNLDIDMGKKLQEKLYELIGLEDISRNEKIEVLNKQIEHVNHYNTILHNLNKEITNDLRAEFYELLYEKLETIGSWECVTSVHNLATIGDCHKSNFGFKNTDCTYRGVFFSVEVQRHKKYLAGVITNDENLFVTFEQKLSPLVGVLNNKKKQGWVVRFFNDFRMHIDGEEVFFVTDFYNPVFNKLFNENMNVIVDWYFQKTKELFEKWKGICEE